MNRRQKQIHDRAVVAGANFRKSEVELICVLQEVDQEKLHKVIGLRSLLEYAMRHMKLSEPVALSAIAVARKAVHVPALKAAISKCEISIATASRLASAMTLENAEELIFFAATHSWRETEREIANRNPKAANPEKVKFLGKGLVQLTIVITEETYEHLQRASSVEAQRNGISPTKGETLAACVQTHLDNHDPVRKAERAAKKNSVRTDRSSEKSNDSNVPYSRNPLTAAEAHEVNLRDRGRCTHVNEQGARCNEDRWTAIHHIIPVSHGGTNHIDNLTTLCWHHHDLIHQMKLPIEDAS